MIVAIVYKNNKPCIGFHNSLLFKIQRDLRYFKTFTENKTVVMGMKTWESLNGPLINRMNIVLTRRRIISNDSNVKFMTFKNFCRQYSTNKDVVVIGGGEIYTLFLKFNYVKNIYITEIKTNKDIMANIYFPFINYNFKLVSYSEKFIDEQQKLSFRFLKFKYYNHVECKEKEYNHLANHVVIYGKDRENRTGINTLSVFNTQMEFNLSDWKLPIITTRLISFKCIVEELLWFCKGYTNAKILDSKGVKIWNDNSSREFLDKRNLNYTEGVLGPTYGWSWRHFGYKYSPSLSDNNTRFGYDQLEYIEKMLKTDPYSRRIFLCAWNPSCRDEMALEPCHGYFQFYVNKEQDVNVLNGYFLMRSSDNIAWCYNVVSYSILLYIFCLKCNMKPGKIIYNAVDCHIYKNNIESLKEQLKNIPSPTPFLYLNPNLKYKKWEEMTFKDFELIGYMPKQAPPMKMAV